MILEQEQGIYEFHNFHLDIGKGILLCGGKPVSMQGKTFELLCVLVKSNGHLILFMTRSKLNLQIIARLFLCAVLLIQPITVPAFETDQYNLPPQPLADIGGEVSDYTEQNLRKAIDKINGEIAARQSCIENKGGKPKAVKCLSPDKEKTKLDYLRSEDAVASELYNLLGSGFPPFTKSGSWMESHQFKSQPARYKTSFSNSIFAVFPTNYLTVSPTVNVYGSQFGTDKIAHFFQQGYTYFKKHNRAVNEGLTAEKATKKAIRWGQASERTFYGTLVSGVYSNADLCANFIGMKFYQGLTKQVKIGDITRPAILLIKNGFWILNEKTDLSETLIKPFFSEHLNEAFNPSIFIPGLRSFVRRSVRKRSCKQWLARYPNLSEAELNKTTRALTQWHGEDYGFTESRKFITVANTCFDGEDSNAGKSE